MIRDRAAFRELPAVEHAVLEAEIAGLDPHPLHACPALTPNGVYKLVRAYSAQLGFEIGAHALRALLAIFKIVADRIEPLKAIGHIIGS